MNTLRDKKVKAKKEHICDFCGKKIAVGEEYRLSTHVCENEIYDWHSCDRCKKYVEYAFEELGNCLNEGLTAEEFYDFMREYYPNMAKQWWS